MFYAVYEVATGRLHAIELAAPAALPAGMACVEAPAYADLQWNPQTLAFDPLPAATERWITRKEFVERFSMPEWVLLVSTKAADPVMAAVFERLTLLDGVDLQSDFVQAASAHAVAQGYMTQSRMDEVLS